MAFGITNQCNDDYYLPFFDYDTFDIATVCLELSDLQERFKLSNVYLIRSTNGYNAFSLDKLRFGILDDIYSKCENVDKDFIKYGMLRGFMTLRMGGDKSHVHTLEYDGAYKKSLPHKKFFSEIMEFDIDDDLRFDNESKLTITTFPSNKHGYRKELFTDG